MKTGIRAGKSYKEQYQAYKIKGMYARNREMRLGRHVLYNPEDLQAANALKSGKYKTYRRRKPMHRGINTGMPIYDKRTKRVVDRIKLVTDLFPNTKPEPVKTVAEQMHNLGIITRIPNRYDRKNARVSRKSK